EHPVHVRTDGAQVGQHPAGDQHQLAAAAPDAGQGPGRAGTDLVALGDRPVVVRGEYVDVHGREALSGFTVSRGSVTLRVPSSSRYTPTVRVIAASSEWCSRTSAWPRRAIVRAAAGSAR